MSLIHFERNGSRVKRDVIRMCLAGREWRLALALLIWPDGWKHLKVDGATSRRYAKTLSK